jgi:hypothetical protein
MGQNRFENTIRLISGQWFDVLVGNIPCMTYERIAWRNIEPFFKPNKHFKTLFFIYNLNPNERLYIGFLFPENLIERFQRHYFKYWISVWFVAWNFVYIENNELFVRMKLKKHTRGKKWVNISDRVGFALIFTEDKCLTGFILGDLAKSHWISPVTWLTD